MLYVELFQSTPLLLQLFLVFFGLPKLGIDVSAWLAAAVCLTLYASAFLTDIWRGGVEAIPHGQWDGSASLGLHYLSQLRLVILPQATRIAIPPTVGFLVQLVKSTALASIVGYHELTRTAQILTNATFQPFLIYGLVALIYFAICFPLTKWSRASGAAPCKPVNTGALFETPVQSFLVSVRRLFSLRWFSAHCPSGWRWCGASVPPGQSAGGKSEASPLSARHS